VKHFFYAPNPAIHYSPRSVFFFCWGWQELPLVALPFPAKNSRLSLGATVAVRGEISV
jgi:hypothetical protein